MKLNRRNLLKYGLPALAAVVAADSTLIEPQRVSLERVSVPLAGLPMELEGFRLAVLSDFHLHPFTKLPHVRDAVNLANSLRPDLVVLLGDYVDATVDAIHELAPELARLNGRLGIFGVLGNHDHWKGATVVRQALEKAGIPVLNNAGVSLRQGRGEFYLAGLDSAWGHHADLSTALAARRAPAPIVLLVHEPDFGDTSAADGRVGLQLSGHSHGGQVRLPGIGALRLPSMGRRYDHGLYRLREMQLYTNRGIGMVDYPVRFNCPPEVTEITLVRQAA